MQLLRENSQEHAPPLVIHEDLIVDSAAASEWIRTDHLSL